MFTRPLPTLKNPKLTLIVTKLMLVPVGSTFRFQNQWCKRDDYQYYSFKNGKYEYLEQVRRYKDKYVSVFAK